MKDNTKQKLASFFEAIRHKNGGRLTPAASLESARERKAEIADILPANFWDDKKISDKYRLHWFRAKIRSVRVEITVHERTIIIPEYIRDPTANSCDQGYVSTLSLRSDEDSSRIALLAEFDRISGLLDRAYKIALALDLEGEVEDIKRRVISVRKRISEPEEAAAH